MEAKLIVEFSGYDSLIRNLVAAKGQLNDENYNKIKQIAPALIDIYHDLSIITDEINKYGK